MLGDRDVPWHQRTDETVQRAVQYGVLGPHLSTENLLLIPAQLAFSSMEATRTIECNAFRDAHGFQRERCLSQIDVVAIGPIRSHLRRLCSCP
jgi:hypothetical protein